MNDSITKRLDDLFERSETVTTKEMADALYITGEASAKASVESRLRKLGYPARHLFHNTWVKV